MAAIITKARAEIKTDFMMWNSIHEVKVLGAIIIGNLQAITIWVLPVTIHIDAP
jgi:hypothetical protein